MSPVPAKPKIYHITHIQNLPSVIRDGCLWSDAVMTARGGPGASIGMSEIKQNRLTRRPVRCHPGDYVGDYVPFYFCPRSIMLYLICRGNHVDLGYRGGQEPIVHLEADLYEVVEWAEEHQRKWAFSLSNAGAAYTEFRKKVENLNEINWTAVRATDFRSEEVKEGKQAEFLLYESFPWRLVRRVGVNTTTIQRQLAAAVASAHHKPSLELCRSWYYNKGEYP